VWLCSFEARFALAPWACTFQSKLALFGAGLLAALLCLGLATLAWREWKRLGENAPSPQGSAIPRATFMAIGGIVLGVGCCLIVIAQTIPEVLLGACE
jgi:hypothetical protein